jgi:hypothetical protein
MTNRRLTITATAAGFVTETEYQNGLGYWTVLSRTVTNALPFVIVGRVADRSDYMIIVRAK